MSVVNVAPDKREPRCIRCGHTPGNHTTTTCTHRTVLNLFAAQQGLEAGYKQCDCGGWSKDETWPPPIVVRDAL